MSIQNIDKNNENKSTYNNSFFENRDSVCPMHSHFMARTSNYLYMSKLQIDNIMAEILPNQG